MTRRRSGRQRGRADEVEAEDSRVDLENCFLVKMTRVKGKGALFPRQSTKCRVGLTDMPFINLCVR